MRLLNARTHKLEGFLDRVPQYAILSHTWGLEEVSFKDLTSNPKVESMQSYKKIRLACQQTLEYGLSYVWCDTCCIDKSSSAELSEAINAIWNYYRSSNVCYAYLNDISLSDQPLEGPGEEHLHKCKWWNRGWTLQELIAPPILLFYDSHWKQIGSRSGNLLSLIYCITNIPVNVLSGGADLRARLKRCSISKRMSWAASRQTTRIEDQAYCLLGIFDVNMPMLYGEGVRAFQRLQEEIIKDSTDHSIFDFDRRSEALYATNPQEFYNCGDDEACDPDEPMESYSMTNRGLLITLPVVRDIAPTRQSNDLPQIEVALNCRTKGGMVRTLVLQQLTKTRSPSNLPLEYTFPAVDALAIVRNTPRTPLESHQVWEREKRTIIIVRRSRGQRPSLG